jgi:BRCT domain type II-containing protein
MPRAKAKPAKSRAKTAKPRAKASARRKAPAPMLNGIPLKRKVVWVYDTDSPQFKAAWERERAALRKSGLDPEIEEFLEDAWRDIDRSLNRQ